jgi:ParB family chromosome partitioning protein
MARKFGLGKGLDALLPLGDGEEGASNTAGNESWKGETWKGETFLALDKINANPGQPRKTFGEEALNELAASIREHGVIQPILVEEDQGGSYTIIAGERRARAARLAGLSEIPAIIRNYSDEKRLVVSIIENIQRSDLDPVEEAQAYKQLMEMSGLSQEEAADRVGKNRATLANALRLLKLPAAMQEALKTGTISPGHARALLSVEETAARKSLFEEIQRNALNVRETENRARSLSNKPPATGEPKTAAVSLPKKKEPEIISMEQKFIETLGTKVVIDGAFNRGTIHIDYYSADDLSRILEILGA